MLRKLITIFSILFSLQANAIEIVLMKGDITQVKADCIVNAANKKLAAGGGVCKAIFDAAGKAELKKRCEKYKKDKSGFRCPVGEAKITDSVKLKEKEIKYVIHAVGPDCKIEKEEKNKRNLLKNAYQNSLIECEKKKCKTIAFPFISSAIFGYKPKEEAAQVAIEAIREYDEKHKDSCIETVYFVLFLDEDYNLFDDVLDGRIIRSSFFKMNKVLVLCGLAAVGWYIYTCYNRKENNNKKS